MENVARGEMTTITYVYTKKPIQRDGNCLFRAVADQVYGDPNLHLTVREWCANFMEEEKQFYEGFILETTNFTKYIDNKNNRQENIYVSI